MRNAVAESKTPMKTRMRLASLWRYGCRLLIEGLQMTKASSRRTSRKPSGLLAQSPLQYIVSWPGAAGDSSLRDLLASHREIVLLQQLDSRTALVAMSEDSRRRLLEAKPGIVVEPNVRYAMHVAI